VEICTIGFTQKSARQFFGILKSAGVERLLDIRISNNSQLAGFTKQADLAYFLDALCGAAYEHEPSLAPTKELLTSYRAGKTSWSQYERIFNGLLAERNVAETLDPKAFALKTVLLCSEPTPEQCHRRLVAEYLQRAWDDVRITHL
jgi:uncharacterized protein (DUF488 family)